MHVLHALSLVIKLFTLAVMIKSFTLAVMLGFVCLTLESPDTCFGDVLHFVRLPENLRPRVVVLMFTLLDFFLCSFSTMWVLLALC